MTPLNRAADSCAAHNCLAAMVVSASGRNRRPGTRPRWAMPVATRMIVGRYSRARCTTATQAIQGWLPSEGYRWNTATRTRSITDPADALGMLVR